MGSGISIALATFNGARYIQDQLDSYLAQTLLPDELVVSDDGSTDDTLKIVKEFARIAPFNVVILPLGRRLGFALNFMRAAAACTGEYIAFSDQDDVWLPAKLQESAYYIRQASSSLSFHTLYSTDEKLRRTGIFRQGIKENTKFEPLKFDPYNNIQGNTILFKSDLLKIFYYRDLEGTPLYNLIGSHDIYVAFLAAAFGNVYAINNPLILYRQHGKNTVGIETQSKISLISKAINSREKNIYLQASFYKSAIEFFEKIIATTSDEKLYMLAFNAKLCYNNRYNKYNERLKIYKSQFFCDRLYFFLKILIGNIVSMKWSRRMILSRAKDLCFGVLYFGKNK